ncbi:MAG TPA: LLM class flavin-dependent oxidoreductase [Solirubrobacteraceae bacterium]|nr:LLM class flavin-dependent oxidoreductase [Solirubrobacteraceae bacterium]
MRFGIFYEHQLPRPWGPGAEQQMIADALEQIEIADRVGFDVAWAVEHHFLEEYSHSSASDVFLAAASQRTKRIRLGLGIMPLPPGYQHPARVAETAAMLDLVSGGRVELGTGETSSGAELGGFGVDRASKRAQWDESLDVMTRMMVEEPFAGWDGRYLSMPQRNVVPKPVQKPHPPLWVACSNRETIRLAGRKGLGALSFSFVEPEEAREWVDEYRSIIASERCVPGGFAVNPRFAVTLPMMIHEDERTALERGLDGAQFFGYSLAHYYVFGEHRPGRTNIYEEFLERRERTGLGATGGSISAQMLQQGLGSLRGAIGTPAQVRELVERYEAAGVDQVIFVMQTGRTRHEHICEAIELFGRDVLPAFAARADDADRAGDDALAGAIAAALARREPPREADPSYVILPGVSGPPAGGDGLGEASRSLDAARVGRLLRARLAEGGEAALTALVKRGDDRLLERVAGTSVGLKLLFSAMTQRFDLEAADGFVGEIQYDLGVGEETRFWTIAIDATGATARPEASADPRLTLKLGLADMLRIATGELDAARAVLTGKLDLEGDLALAMRLGTMFGQSSVF